MKALFLALVTLLSVPLQAQESLLTRQYREGEQLRYTMWGKNKGQHGTRYYSATSLSRIRKSDDIFSEETSWTTLNMDGNEIALPTESKAFRQILSLDPDFKVPMPDISKVHSGLT